jgi:hypothetical protein
MRKLLAIVRPHVPTADRLDPDKLFRSFSACFDLVANIGCQPTSTVSVACAGLLMNLFVSKAVVADRLVR